MYQIIYCETESSRNLLHRLFWKIDPLMSVNMIGALDQETDRRENKRSNGLATGLATG